MTKNKQVQQLLVNLKNRIVRGPFGHSGWIDLGALTGLLDEVERHPRLLRSLDWGDDDYDEHVLPMLKKMVDAETSNLQTIVDYVGRKLPDTEGGENVSSEKLPGRRIYFTPNVFMVPECEVDSRLVSVMMPINAGTSAVYDSISAAVKDVGLTCERADNIWEHSVIVQDIFSLIFRSNVVICDFSGKNPNVFYEAGIAHTLGKHVVPITQSAEDVPFDLKHHRYILYLNNKEGRKAMQTELTKRLKTLTKSSRAMTEVPDSAF